MSSPFDYMNAINFTKQDMFKDPQADAEYNSYLVNKGLSYFIDTLMHANEMNRYPDISNNQQFSFLIYSISKKKRFSKWAYKEDDSENLENVCAYYGFSKREAKGMINILTEDQLLYIKEKQNKGGNFDGTKR